MHRRPSARALLLVLPLALAGCGDIGLDNIGDFVVTYKVTVTVDSPHDVLVSISTPDATRSVWLDSGSVTATSFKLGSVTVGVTDRGSSTSERQDRMTTIERDLESGLLEAADPARARRLRDELRRLNEGMDPSGPWVTCTMEVQPDPQGSNGNDLAYVVGVGPDGTARLSGPGC